MPKADLLYGCDAKWWRYYLGVPEFHGIKVSLEETGFPDVRRVRNADKSNGGVGMELDPSRGVVTGSNSGFQAINLAVHLGAGRIVLLGYDMKSSQDGRRHWFGEHPEKLRANSKYDQWLKKFWSAKPVLDRIGVEVINCTPGSALECFPTMPLWEVVYECA